jgi:RNA polymerase sigma factor (sigma-70 family)
MITPTKTVFLEDLKDLSNEAAWGEFDRRYRPLLMGTARRLGLKGADADDAAQETLTAFVADCRDGRYRRERGRLRDWLAGIMAHKVRDIQRRHHRAHAASLHESGALEIEDHSIQAALEEETAKAVLRQCLAVVRDEVSPVVFECFDLFALRQWPAQQVAGRLGISVDLVYQNKRRMLQRVRELVNELEETW